MLFQENELRTLQEQAFARLNIILSPYLFCSTTPKSASKLSMVGIISLMCSNTEFIPLVDYIQAPATLMLASRLKISSVPPTCYILAVLSLFVCFAAALCSSLPNNPRHHVFLANGFWVMSPPPYTQLAITDLLIWHILFNYFCLKKI